METRVTFGDAESKKRISSLTEHDVTHHVREEKETNVARSFQWFRDVTRRDALEMTRNLRNKRVPCSFLCSV